MNPATIGIAAVGLVAILCVIVYLFVASDNEPTTHEIPEPSARKAIIAESNLPIVKRPEPKDTPAKPTKAERVAKYIEDCERRYAGKEMPPGLKTELYYLKNPPKKEYGGMITHPYLAHTSERDIASVLYVEPGTAFLEPPKFGDDFDQDFVNALVDKIKIENDDSPEVRDAKLFVTQMKEELAKAVKETGKKPSEIMTEQGQLMFEMGRFEQQLAEELRRAEENPDLTDEDVTDYFAAANALREKKGLAPHELPDLTRRTIRIKHELRRQAREYNRQNNANPQYN